MPLFPQGFHRSLAKIQNLRKFCLSSDKVTSDGLSVLASLTALTHLDFTRCTGIKDGVYDLTSIASSRDGCVFGEGFAASSRVFN